MPIMKQLCVNSKMRTQSSTLKPDPASLLSAVMLMCYDTLCRHAKLNGSSHRRKQTYLSCDF